MNQIALVCLALVQSHGILNLQRTDVQGCIIGECEDDEISLLQDKTRYNPHKNTPGTITWQRHPDLQSMMTENTLTSSNREQNSVTAQTNSITGFPKDNFDVQAVTQEVSKSTLHTSILSRVRTRVIPWEQVSLPQKVKDRKISGASFEARVRDDRLDCTTMYASINAACVVLVLAASVFTAALLQVTDMNLMKVIPALLLHMFNFQQHAQSIFVRPSTGTGARLAPLDGIRAWAFLMVAFDHWYIEWIGFETLVVGQHGVNIFYCLSGFLIPLILVKSTERAKGSSVLKQIPAFLCQRFLRVWPSINWIVPLTLAFFGWAWPLPPCSSFWTYCCAALWTPFLCINNYVPRGDSPFLHLYTVSTEMQMYLCTPLMVLTYYRSDHPYTGYVVALFVLLGCLLASHVLKLDSVHYPGLLWDCLPFYIMGMLSSYSYMDSIERNSGRWWLLDPLRLWQWRALAVLMVSLMQASIVFVVVFTAIPAHGTAGMAIAVGAAFLIRSSLDPDLSGLGLYVFASWPLYPVAQLAYTGYLWSRLGPGISITLFMEMFSLDNAGPSIFIACFLFSMFIVFVMAFFLSIFIERPFMSIRDFSYRTSGKV